MASLEGISRFISTLRVHFNVYLTEPNRERKEQDWMRSMASTIRGYEDGILDLAVQRILDTRSDRRFPLPGEIIKVCSALTRDAAAPKLLQSELINRKANPLSRDRIALTIELMGGAMGRQAIDEGWIGSLFDEVRRRAELPGEREIPRLRRSAEDFQRTLEGVIRGDGFPKTPAGLAHKLACEGMGESIARRNRLVAAVIEGRASIDLLFVHLRNWDEDKAGKAA